MTTIGNLVDEIATSLRSYTGVQEVSTYLSAGITASDLAVPVNSSDEVDRGVIEIDNELLYVNIADAGSLSIPPYGRGYRGSTAATHAINAEVVVDPAFPRVEIFKAINQCVAGLFPKLFQVKTTTLAYTVNPIVYSLPADCETVLDVRTTVPGDPTQMRVPIYDWAFDRPSQQFTLTDELTPGSTIYLTYSAKFGTVDTSVAASDISTIGLDEAWVDLIVYQVTSRMIRFTEPARLQVATAENLSRSAVVQVGDATKVANQLYAVYQQRLGEERRRLLELYPPRIHFQR